MANSNEEIIQQGYKAFGEGDMDTLRSLYAPDAVHTAPGRAGTFKADLTTAKAEGADTVVATHHGTAQRGGNTFEQVDTLTFTLAGGKVTEIVEEHSDQAAYDAFWS